MSGFIELGLQENEMAAPKHFSLQFYLRQQPVVLALIFLLLIVFFVFVTGLSRAYYAQRQALGTRWFNRGVEELKVKLSGGGDGFPCCPALFAGRLLLSTQSGGGADG